jgi:lipopolysaccharide biosynthesis glycosyltransferase
LVNKERKSIELFVVYSCDDNYAQHVGISMISLFETNKNFNSIEINLIDNNISETNKLHLKNICKMYNRTIEFIPFDKIYNRLNLNMTHSISLSSYARLFLASMLPNTVDKVLYLDSDSLIASDLSELWQTDLKNYYVAGVKDTVSDLTKINVGLKPEQPYINAGMLLINLKKWRESNIENQFIKFIERANGDVFHHDQGTINGVLNKKMVLLHPKFNVMTTFFTMKREDILKYYGLRDYYTELELKEATTQPVFIHFTPAFVNRPWIKGCKHPLVSLYKEYADLSPWANMTPSKDSRSLPEKIISFLFNNLPFKTAYKLSRAISR